ncbi:9069_t:CDS:1, partial [Ambispora leptoticha]
DPLVTNNSLIINGNSIVVHDGTDIITSFQYVLETEPDLPTQHLENVDILNNYFPDIAFDDLTFFIEPVEKELDVLPPQLDADIVQIQDTENEVLARLIKDFTEVKEEVFLRCNPLIGVNFKEKLREIVSRLKEESCEKSHDQQIRILETAYYLEQLKKEVDSSKDKIQKIRDNLKKALGPRRAARAWKCAEQIYQLFQ